MTSVTVSAGARLHFGCQNLSLARERLYGGIGVGLERPRVEVTVTPDDDVVADDPLVAAYAERACAALEVPGVSVTVDRRLPRHVGLGSGTQLALAVLQATAATHGVDVSVREQAPALGRAGRSGIGVATFESGGFVADAGHPTGRFTTDPPAEGDWTVPPVVTRHDLPEDWRFLVVIPAIDPGRSGDDEDDSIRRVIEAADPHIADDIAGLLTRRLLPAAAEGRLEAFGEAIAAIGHKNGAWYTDVQGGVFRPPAGELVDTLSASPVVTGVGQSSWGPTVYGVTDVDHADEAVGAAESALESAGIAGSVQLSRAASDGARVEP